MELSNIKKREKHVFKHPNIINFLKSRFSKSNIMCIDFFLLLLVLCWNILFVGLLANLLNDFNGNTVWDECDIKSLLPLRIGFLLFHF